MDNALIKIVAQIFGFVAVCSSIIIYSRKTKKKILVFKAVQDICWLTHYIMLGVYPSAATSALCVSRSFVFYGNEGAKRSRWWLVIYLAAYAVAAALTWNGAVSILPAVSSSVSTVAFWMKKPDHTKMLSILAASVTMTYNILFAHSLSVYLGASFTILTSLFSLIALRVQAAKNEKN